jgi:hypothetical protein
MALLQETNQEYYVGQKVFYILAGDSLVTLVDNLVTSFNTELIDTVLNTINTNYILETSSDSGVSWFEYGQVGSTNPTALPFGVGEKSYRVLNNTTNIVEFNQTINNVSGITWLVRVRILPPALYDNYGSYEYISLNDVINNFIVGYVGKDKIISDIKRTDIMFHAKRGLQEFSYDTLKSIKSQELTVPPSLSVIIPQDYVNYVKCSWVDSAGAKHIIYPTRVTSNPTELPIQDSDGTPTQDEFGENEQAATSITDDRWAAQDNTGFDNFNDYRYPDRQYAYGRRYGLQPEEAQINGKFTINERLGKFSFSSDLNGKLIILEYISDGLAADGDTKLPKMAEEAMYLHIAHAVLSTRMNIPEYVINRFKKDRRAALRNAKIRLSNIKLEEISQVFRNKSKIIKH